MKIYIKTVIIVSLIALIAQVSMNTLFAQEANTRGKLFNETEEQKKERMAWWVNDRFGMFIHWGLYAMPTRDWDVKKNERLTNEDYQKYFDNFNPDLYNPREWAEMAKAAGMKYAVITTKHLDGFCLFDSKLTDYKSVSTPCGKDLLKEWVDAFRAEGLKVGFYYSLSDWHHPDFTIDKLHPQFADDKAKLAELNKDRDMNKYREYLHGQVRELLSNYGKVDILWLDWWSGGTGKGRKDFDSENLIKMARQLQPGILIDDRADLKEYEDGWDFLTPEEEKVRKWPEVNGKRVPWETCQTFSGSWGYRRDEYTWKDTKQLLVLLIESVSKGGNLLLNVGPTARGTFDERAQKAHSSIGNWMKWNNRSIYGCTQASEEFKAPENSLLTYNPKTNRLYIHLLDYPLRRLHLPGYAGKIKYAQFLHDASEIKISKNAGYENLANGGDVDLILPVVKPNDEVPVIELIVK